MQTKERITVSVTPAHVGRVDEWKNETPELSRSAIIEMLIMTMADYRIVKAGWRYEFQKKNSDG